MNPLIVVALLAAPQDPPTYAGALRCLALVNLEADARQFDVNDPAFAAAFDAGIEWTMAAYRLRDLQGISWAQFEADEEAATAKAKADFAAGGDAVRAQVAACIKTAPPLSR